MNLGNYNHKIVVEVSTDDADTDDEYDRTQTWNASFTFRGSVQFLAGGEQVEAARQQGVNRCRIRTWSSSKTRALSSTNARLRIKSLGNMIVNLMSPPYEAPGGYFRREIIMDCVGQEN